MFLLCTNKIIRVVISEYLHFTIIRSEKKGDLDKDKNIWKDMKRIILCMYVFTCKYKCTDIK